MTQLRNEPLGWDYLDDLAREYHGITQTLLPKDGKIYREKDLELDGRSDRQKEIAGEIITGAYPFIRNIVHNLLNGDGRIVKNKTRTKRFYLSSLRDFVTEDDLVDSASIELMKSLHRYNPDLSRISTFINNSVIWGLTKEPDAGFIRLPLHIRTQARRALKDGDGLTQRHRIQNGMNSSVDTTANIHHALTGDYVSLDKLIGEQSFMNPRYGVPRRKSFAEAYLEDKSYSGNTSQQVQDSLRDDVIKKVLSTLSKREEGIIKLRFGLGGKEPQTLEEIGSVYNITRNRVRQIEDKALRKLRHPIRARELKPYIQSSTGSANSATIIEDDSKEFFSVYSSLLRNRYLPSQVQGVLVGNFVEDRSLDKKSGLQTITMRDKRKIEDRLKLDEWTLEDVDFYAVPSINALQEARFPSTKLYVLGELNGECFDFAEKFDQDKVLINAKRENILREAEKRGFKIARTELNRM